MHKDRRCDDNKVNTSINISFGRTMRKRSVSHVEQRIKGRRYSQKENEKREKTKRTLKQNISVEEKNQRASSAETFDVVIGSITNKQFHHQGETRPRQRDSF